MKGKIDRFLERWSSRKLMVFAIATLLMISSDLASSDWVNIAIVYIGTQGALDIAERLKK